MTAVANPILPGCYPDPSICRVGDDYYLVSSSFEYAPGLPLHRSRDLVSWEPIGHAIDRPGQLDLDGLWSSSGLYAPTIRHHAGTFWIVCTLVDQRDAARGGNFYVTATDPAGPWSDPVWLDADGIDPSIFFDDDGGGDDGGGGGRVWVHGTRLARDPAWHDQTEVWLRELDPVAGRLVGEEHVLWRGALHGAVWAEGPHLYRVDGRYYLLAAEGGTEFHHAVAVAVADVVTGPYTGHRGNPVLTHRHLGRGTDVVGVGHADLVQAVDGSWWAVLLGMRPYGGYHDNLGRETFLVPVVWEDGWPVVAPGVGRVPAWVDVPFAAEHRPGVTQGTTSGLVRPDDVRWTALRRPVREVATPAGDGWDLPLTPGGPEQPGPTAFVGVRQQHVDVDVRATLRADLAPGSREEVGLLVRQSEADHVRLVLTAPDGTGTAAAGDGTSDGVGRRVRAVHRRGGEDRVLGECTVPGRAGDPVVLGVSARGQDYALLAGAPGTDGPAVVAVADGRTLDSVATGGFLGLWIGVHATSNGAPTATVAHVERFEYLLPPGGAADPEETRP